MIRRIRLKGKVDLIRIIGGGWSEFRRGGEGAQEEEEDNKLPLIKKNPQKPYCCHRSGMFRLAKRECGTKVEGRTDGWGRLKRF